MFGCVLTSVLAITSFFKTLQLRSQQHIPVWQTLYPSVISQNQEDDADTCSEAGLEWRRTAGILVWLSFAVSLRNCPQITVCIFLLSLTRSFRLSPYHMVSNGD